MEWLTIVRFWLIVILGTVAIVEAWRAGKLEAENDELFAELQELRKAQTEDEQ